MYSTFIHAVPSGYLSTWPRLTAAIVNARPLLTIATAKGHLNRHRQGLDSTKQLPLHDTAIDITDDNDTLPHMPVSEASANHVYVKVLPLLHTVSTDLTGKFPITANTGAQYVLISEMDKCIHAEPMASRHHTAYIAGFTRTIAFFAALGRSPSFLRLDNETSHQLDTFMKRENVSLQYCPPGMHRANKAERNVVYRHSRIMVLLHCARPLKIYRSLFGIGYYPRSSYALTTYIHAKVIPLYPRMQVYMAENMTSELTPSHLQGVKS